MTTAYTSLLGLALPVQGELQGTWGDTVNNAITSLLDTAVAGTTSITTDADITLTTTTGASNQARQAIILWNPASGTTTRNITAPAQSKMYTVINATGGTQSIVLRGAGPTTGVTIVAGEKAVCAWNGSDFVKVGSTVANAGGSNTQVQFNSSGVLAGSASLTWSGTVLTSSGFAGPLNGTVGATTPAAGSFTTTTIGTSETLSYGTANGVAYLNGSKVLTSGSALTFDGTTLQNSATNAKLSALNVGGTGGGGLYLGSGASTDFILNFDSTPYVKYNSVNSWPHTWTFGATEAMRLTSTGLGIGTSSPSAKLQAVGSNAGSTSLFERTTASTAVPVFASRSLATSSGDMADGFGPTHAFAIQDTAAVINPISEIGAVREGADNTGGLVFRTYVTGTATTQMRLDSSGNLGLGVTPSAWGGSYKALQNPAGSLSAFSTSQLGLNLNTYDTGVGTFTYVNTAFASRYLQLNGQHHWYTAPSGTAGNAITFTQAMTLDASGNLGIGTTNPPVTLSVVGTVGIFGGSLNGSIGSPQLYRPAADTLAIATGATERMRIDSSGNVGIGTSSPTNKLQVQSSGAGDVIRVLGTGSGAFVTSILENSNSGGYAQQIFNVGAAGANGQAQIGYAPGMFFAIGPASNDTTTPIVFRNNNATERMRIDSSGYVLIGATSSAGVGDRRLEILSATNNTAGFLLNTTSYNYAGIYSAGDSNIYNYWGTSGSYLFGTANRNTQSFSEKMRIDSSGNVGIGTSSPAGNLQISGSGDRSLLVTGGTAGTVSVQLGDSGAAGQGGMSYDNSVDALFFKSNGTERMRIASNGQRSTNVVSTVGTSYDTLYPAYDCRAWVNFNGTGTVAIRASGNVSSITDNGTGDYTVNFTTAMPDANYSATCGACRSDGTPSTYLGMNNQTVPSTTAARFRNRDDDGAAVDALFACVAFFR
jgi:hypothetical protein